MAHKIDAKTRLYGIIGNPLGHTFSPAMHNAAFEAACINAVYLAFPVKNLIQLKHSLKQLNVRGLSVTIPYKTKVRRIVTQIDPLALQIGSINTIIWGNGDFLEGHNTDGPGAVRAIIEEGFDLKGKNVLIIGSGGSARGIAMSLLGQNVAGIGVLARNSRAALNLVRNLRMVKKGPAFEIILSKPPRHKQNLPLPKSKYGKELLTSVGQLEKYDLIINTTPVGMSGHSEEKNTPIEKEFLLKNHTVFDIVYNPENTGLLKMARQKKLDIIKGYKMLLYQGALQFELFTGESAPVEVMQKALLAQLKQK